MKRVLIIAAVVALCIPAAALASGFGYYEHGAKATAMAGAFVARADDASAIFYNPAGIAFLEGTSIYGAFHPVKPNTTATYASISTDATTGWIPPASAFISHKFNDNIAVGFGFFIPFGLSVEWPENWIGNQIAYYTALRAYYFQPTVAFKVNDNFSIGAGVDIVYSKVELQNKTHFSISPLLPTAVIDTQLEGTTTSYGFNVGALFKASDKLQIGLKYSGEVEMEFDDGNIDFTATATGVPLLDGTVAAVFVDQNAKTTITLPAIFAAGVMYKMTDDFTVEADIQWTGWSSYDTLVIEPDNALLTKTDVNEWDDVLAFRIGGEYWMNHDFALRAGYIYDESPIPASSLKPLLPGADRNEFTFGFGYDTKESCCWGRLTLDCAVQYLIFEDRTSEYPAFPADFESDALILGFGMGVTF